MLHVGPTIVATKLGFAPLVGFVVVAKILEIMLVMWLERLG